MLQKFEDGVDPVLWAMAVKLDPSAYPQGRDALAAVLGESGIETRPGFYPASVLGLYDCPPLAVSEAVSRQVISLPMFPTLKESQVDFICARLRQNRR